MITNGTYKGQPAYIVTLQYPGIHSIYVCLYVANRMKDQTGISIIDEIPLDIAERDFHRNVRSFMKGFKKED